MGWSDVALCLSGPVVQDLRTHFAQRWNFIYDEKYSKKATRYSRLPETSSGAQQGGVYPPPPMQQRGFEDEDEGTSVRRSSASSISTDRSTTARNLMPNTALRGAVLTAKSRGALRSGVIT
jgi:phosphatidylserine/phosphatidylglycerophosphate/cardiolipin synthase-like enzyme